MKDTKKSDSGSIFVFAVILTAAFFSVSPVSGQGAAAAGVTDDYGDKLGTVHVAVSCNEPALRDRAGETSAYWANQVEIQRLSATAWLVYGEGRQDEALETMERAAGLEAATEKHPVTPGEVLPARELLADMLLDMGRHEEAQAAYEATLARSANRFNSLYGAGRAVLSAVVRSGLRGGHATPATATRASVPGLKSVIAQRVAGALGSVRVNGLRLRSPLVLGFSPPWCEMTVF